MNWTSPYWKNIDEAIGNASDLVKEDDFAADDRQVIANFYNGRELMSNAEAEEQNIANIVNHLFGYGALNGFKLQIAAIYSAGQYLWTPDIIKGAQEHEKAGHQVHMANSFNRHIKKSRRLKPEVQAMSGDLVLHARAVMMFRDNFDWCPRIAHVYVPKGTGTVSSDIPYAFVADNIPYWKLKEQQRNYTEGGLWDKTALDKAIKYIEQTGAVSLDNQNSFGYENPQQSQNQDEQTGMDFSTAMDLPVWYIYEVNHDNPALPVDVKIVTRYELIGTGRDDSMQSLPKDDLLFSQKNHFKHVQHWIHPIFMDTEIGGRPTWHSVTGIGRLNYERDGDVEEFFNLAMDGAKDKMRTKWQTIDGASREKLQRFFARREDVVPEGIKPVEMKYDPGYQHAMGIMQLLQQTSKEDAGAGFSNAGSQGDELEIQAAERQQRSGFQVSARMDDVYEGLDDLGAEVFRRFCNLNLSKSRMGYREIKAFQDDMEEREIDFKKYGKSDRFGELKNCVVKTSRAAGDGSEVSKMRTNAKLMSWLGLFPPEGQELVKRRVVADETRDTDFAESVVPFEPQPDPDQLARARQENISSLQRGIVGFVAQRNKDDLDPVHTGEHKEGLDAAVATGRAQGYFTQPEAKGFESLATHQMIHIRNMQQTGVNPEAANELMQALQGQTREADALAKQGEQREQQDELSAMDRHKIENDLANRQMDQQKQSSIEQDRANKDSQEERKIALAEVTKTQDSATKAAAVTLAPQGTNE